MFCVVLKLVIWYYYAFAVTFKTGREITKFTPSLFVLVSVGRDRDFVEGVWNTVYAMCSIQRTICWAGPNGAHCQVERAEVTVTGQVCVCIKKTTLSCESLCVQTLHYFNLSEQYKLVCFKLVSWNKYSHNTTAYYSFYFVLSPSVTQMIIWSTQIKEFQRKYPVARLSVFALCCLLK